MIKISYKRFSKRSHKINSNNVVGPERALHCPGGCPTRQFAKLICTKFAKQTDRAWEGITPAPGTACWVRHRPAWQQNTPSAIFDLVFIKFRHFFTRRWDNLPAFATLHIEVKPEKNIYLKFPAWIVSQYFWTHDSSCFYVWIACKNMNSENDKVFMWMCIFLFIIWLFCSNLLMPEFIKNGESENVLSEWSEWK